MSRTEDTLRDLSRVLIEGGHYTPEMEKRAAEQQREWAEQRAEFEAMTVDQLEDLILDLEDEIEQAEKQGMETRRLAPSRGRHRKTGGDRQQRKAALREQFAAGRAYNEAREKSKAARSRLNSARSVWVNRVFELPAAKAPAGGDE